MSDDTYIRADEVRVGDTVSNGRVGIVVGRISVRRDRSVKLVEATRPGLGMFPRGGIMDPDHRLRLIKRSS